MCWGLAKKRQSGAAPLAVVTGDEGDALREPAVRERQSRAGRGAQGRGDPGHHDVGNTVGLQDFELLAAAAEDERVATLQARDALSGAGELDQQLVDALLLAALTGLLADKDAARVAARAIEYGLAHQAVIEDHVGLLQQLQSPQRQQIRIAGAGADQIHLTERSPCAGAAVVSCEARSSRRSPSAARGLLAARARRWLPGRARCAPRRHAAPPVRQRPLHRLRCRPMKRARAPRRAGSRASICSRTPRASTGAAPAELTATMSGERSMIAGKMKVESSGIIDDVDRNAARAGRRGDGRVHRALVGGRDDGDRTVEELRREGGGTVRERPH